MDNQDGSNSFWTSPCVVFVANRILATFSQWNGAKFQKAFQTEANGYVPFSFIKVASRFHHCFGMLFAHNIFVF